MSNTIIRNVEFRWAKLDPKNPVNPFGSLVWELSVHIPKDQLTPEFASLSESPVRDGGDGTVYVVLRKRATKADGSPQEPVQVLDANKQSMDATIIGNGSKGHIKVFQPEYSYNGRKGHRNILMAVMVTELVKFEKLDFTSVFDEVVVEPINYRDAY